ncbi:MAG: CvpA family protein [Clostridia bacterium]|nr:CvpA family protein [Clostridia bacterium]
MEPIKVDFSGNGKKKSVKDVLIPPDKPALKIGISVAVMILTAVLGFYFMLPAINLGDYKFYGYIFLVLGSYVAASFVTSGAFKKPEFVPYVKRRSLIPAILAGVVLAVLVVGYLVSAPLFRAKAYSKILTLDETKDFKSAVTVIDSMSDFNNVALIDKDAAAALADKQLGGFAELGLESQFELLLEDSTQINFNGQPCRVYPLKYGDIFKWFTNSVVGDHEGIPGYVIVNLNTQKAELVKNTYDIKYSTAEHFSEYLVRYLRFRYPFDIFGEISFEIRDDGRPFWVVEVIEKTIGLLGGEDVKGIIVVDAETGEHNYYEKEAFASDNSEIQWIDQAFDADLLVQQYNYHGKYENGFINSFIGQAGVKQASVGYSFLAIDDDVYLYTGVTSVTSDNSILGFFLINQRTKDAYFYETAGATEAAAQLSAEGKVQNFGWKASFPILLNIDGQPTYYMALKDNSNVVKSYAMVNVEQYSVVAKPTNNDMNLRSCLENYIGDLAALSNPVKIHFDFDADAPGGNTDPGSDTPAIETKEGVIAEIRSAVLSGNTVVYLRLEGETDFYAVTATAENRVVLLNVGDAVAITAYSGSLNAESVTLKKAGEPEPEPEPTTQAEPSTEPAPEPTTNEE